MSIPTDKAGKEYWDDLWQERRTEPAINPRTKGLNNFVARAFDAYLRNALHHLPASATLLEIGCAGSPWLPYFALDFGFQVTGIDYSELGCQQARAILRDSNVSGEVVCSDFFAPPAYLVEHFDVVVSFGVAEHFTDTGACLAAFARFLKPGGLMITSVPNMVGVLGHLQSMTNPGVFDIHVPLDVASLVDAHKHAGLQVDSCDYFLSANWGVLNLEGWSNGAAYHIATKLRSWFSKAFWLLDENGLGIPSNRLTSPYLMCVAKKPCD